MKRFIRITITLIISSFYHTVFSQIVPPYDNKFDTNDTVAWIHYAISGTDDWQLGIPNKYHTNYAFSSPNVWATTVSNWYPASYSDRALQTPTFDFSNTPNNLVLSFFHKGAGTSGTTSILEYSINGGLTWAPLTNTGSPNKNWQNNISGFPCCVNSSLYTYYQSAINLNFLQGNSNVKFRFRYSNGYVSGYMDGWVIDNFAIFPEFYNVKAITRDTISNINKYFNKLPIKYDFMFTNQYSQNYNFTNKFYFSHDTIKDASDILLASKTFSANQSINAVNDTIPIPSGLPVGKYYILYDFDASNILNENVETDNSNFFVFNIDSVYKTNFLDRFDSTSNNWNKAISPSLSLWKMQPPNYFRMEKSHSSPNSFNIKSSYANNLLETPYLDLSTKTNQSICFWYKQFANTNMANDRIVLFYPPFKSFKLSSPTYPSGVDIPLARNNNKWDCYCVKLSSGYDTIVSTKFAFKAENNNFDLLFAIDDFYIGESKPDVSTDFEDNTFFTNSSVAIDTLVYTLWNSGIEILPSTISEFYWSNDSLLDASDILIGTSIEPSIMDTLFVKRKVSITKPNLSSGNYFIIYMLDKTNQVDEMREYNNTGYLKVIQSNSESLPYFNDFETNSNNWYHQALLGNDDWVCSVPTKSIMSTAFSVSKGWVTSNQPFMSKNSKSYLYTPLFDFTQLNHAILEYDYIQITDNGFTHADEVANIDYSIDGGCTWHLLDTTGKSFANFYYYTNYDNYTGLDWINSSKISTLISNKDEKTFSSTLKYQGRDELNTIHHAIDVRKLINQKKVIFRIKVVNANFNSEGVYIDNFKISDAKIDLAINRKKNIQAASTDKFISTFFNINNNGNFISPTSQIKMFVSNDTLLDIADSLIFTKAIDEIRPNTQFYCNVRKYSTLLNSGGTKYLVYSLDPNNLIQESDESNNIGYFKLTNGNGLSPIYFNNFNNYTIDGWTFYQGDTIPGGFPNPPYYNQRFRHNRVMEEPAYHFMYPNIDTTKHEWFMDQFSDIFCLSHLMAVNYIESPTFDFSTDSVYQLRFEINCAGTSGVEGANIQYTKDGGVTWNVITRNDDSTALGLYYNYYPLVQSLNYQQGWGWEMNRLCKINLSFLSGVGNVKFRFAYKGKWMPCADCVNGFKMDDFKILSLGYVMPPQNTFTPINNLKDDKLIRNMGNNTYIITNNNECEILKLKVFDAQGRDVGINQTFTCLDSRNLFVNLSYLQSGIYFISVIENNTHKNYKVIVSN